MFKREPINRNNLSTAILALKRLEVGSDAGSELGVGGSAAIFGLLV
jgi:hypothetical protein